MKSNKTFILGLGFQKSGTTWLSNYLKQCDNYDGGITKEYHIWDALDLPLLDKHFVKKEHFKISSLFKKKKSTIRRKMQNDDKFYFDYFNSLLVNDINLTGDITPSYSGLDVERLNFIKNNFQKRGIDCKVIILIRNPLNRIKSAVRYNLDRFNYEEGVNQNEKDFFKAMKQYYKSEHCLIRTNYHTVIERAFDVFPVGNVYIGFYENMFQAAEIEKLSDFCGVPIIIEYGGVSVNKTKNKVQIDVSLDEEIKAYYEDVYKYCYLKFPILKELWK